MRENHNVYDVMMTSNHKLYNISQTTIHLVIIVAAVHDSLFVFVWDKSHVSVTLLISNNVSMKLTSDIDRAIISNLISPPLLLVWSC